MASGTIIHPGVIEKIEDDKVFVRILSQSACSACHAKSACMVADMKEKIIEVDAGDGGKWKTGEEVMVRMDESLGRKAVILGYGLPMVVLFASVIIFLSLFDHEGIAALCSILMLVPYYLVLYLFRQRLHKEFRFRIE
jgi:sigma-E factor negative regulatory protein RseC